MPTIDASAYRPPLFPRGAHWETILPNVTRRRIRVPYRRERLELSDGDFVDLDFSLGRGSDRADTCVLALHGLEGSSDAPYVKSLAWALRKMPWDFVAMNLRGCSGELNRALRFYHSGETGDLREAVQYLQGRYARIALVGFSLGGNVVLKYLGEDPDRVPEAVVSGVAVSAPIDLEGSALRIGGRSNAFYMRRFIRLLSAKVEAKAEVYPEMLDASRCRELRNFAEFDGRYTAPLNGFASAQDYWRRCSALNWLGAIRCPALLINARNDPFLSAACFPELLVAQSDWLYSIFPDRGGHLGFPGRRVGGRAWHERVALEFIRAC